MIMHGSVLMSINWLANHLQLETIKTRNKMIRCNFLDLDKSTYLSLYMPQIPQKGDKIKLNNNIYLVHDVTYDTHNGHCHAIEIGIRSESSINSF